MTRRRRDVRHRAQGFNAAPHDRVNGGRRRGRRSGQRHSHREDMVWIEAGIDLGQSGDGPHQQSTADEQHHGQRDLQAHEAGFCAAAPRPRRRAGVRRRHRRVQVSSRSAHGRRDTRDERGADRHGAGERDQPPVGRKRCEIVKARHAGQADHREQARGQHSERKTSGSADSGQQEALGQQLTNDAPAPGPERQSDGDFARAGGALQ